MNKRVRWVVELSREKTGLESASGNFIDEIVEGDDPSKQGVLSAIKAFNRALQQVSAEEKQA